MDDSKKPEGDQHIDWTPDRKSLEAQARQQLGYPSQEKLDGLEQQAVDQAVDRAIQEDAAARGIRPSEMKVGEHGTPMGVKYTGGNVHTPRISDFWLIDTTMTPESFQKLLSEEVLGNYIPSGGQGDAEFGVIVMRHIHGIPKIGTALPAESQKVDDFLVASAHPMILAKLDAGPWPWYEAASLAMMSAIIRRVGRRGWRCGWAVEKQWSWVEAWRPDKKTGEGKPTETIDGPSNGEVTRKAAERWGIDVRAAFDELHLAAQFEALRQWMILPEPRPLGFPAQVSHLAGKLLIQDGDQEWIPQKWEKHYPGRDPKAGPLHLHQWYTLRNRPKSRLERLQETEGALSFRREPPSLPDLGGGERR